MKSPRFARLFAGVLALATFAPLFAGAQLSPEKVAAINKTLQNVKAAYNKLDGRHRRMLDGYANIVHFADAWQRYGMRLTDPSFIARSIHGYCQFLHGWIHPE
jgi:hypothetical protein